jgi:hypothetical protein
MSPEVGWCELRLPGTESRVGLNAIGEGEIANPNWGKLTLEVEDLEKAKSPLFFQVSRQVLVLTVSVTLNLSKRWIPQGLRAR